MTAKSSSLRSARGTWKTAPRVEASGIPPTAPSFETGSGTSTPTGLPHPASATKPVVRFNLSEQFWQDWLTNWLLYGTVYAINLPEPRIVPYPEIEVRKRSENWPDSLDAAMAEAVAALPPDWRLKLSVGESGRRDLFTATASYCYSLRHYRENVGRARFCPFEMEHATDPVVALRALTIKLRGLR